MTRLLVTAATGTVGQHVVRSLVAGDPLAEDEQTVEDGGRTVAVGTRDPDEAREFFADLDSGGERTDGERHVSLAFVEFDFQRPETWGRALDGVDGVFLVRPPGVATDEVTALVDAAARVGVDRVAYLSTLGADRNVLIPHHRIERHVAGADLAHTFLRASFFGQNLHEVHRADVVENDAVFVPAGDGETSFVDARDVGAVGARVLTEPGHRDRAYDLTGPEALDYGEVAAVMSDVLDREITYADPSVPAFVRRMRSRGYPLGYVFLMVGIYTTARLGFAGRVTDDVERLLGRPPRSVRDYVTDYADQFRYGTDAPDPPAVAAADD